jgi:general secretion pathway protein K
MRKRRRGSVIVVVLVLITLASLLLARFMEDNSLELAMATREVDRSRLRMDAMSELELALAVIAEIRSIDLNKIHDPAQGYDDPHKYSGIAVREGLEVNFEYEDESGKLPLSTLDKNTLIQLLYSLGLEQRDAERVADAMVAWTSKKYESIEEEATDAAYQRAKLSFKPARRPLRSFEELRTIGVAKDFFFDEDGNPTRLLRDFQQCVSLYTFGDTNINTASDALLLAQGLDERQLALIRDRQNEQKKRAAGTPPYFRVTSEVRQLIGAAGSLSRFDDEVHLMWVRVTVKEGQAKCRVSALVAIREDVTFTAASADPDTASSIDALTGTTTTRTFTPTTTASTSSTGVTATPTSGMGRGFGGGFGATTAKTPTALTPGVVLNSASAVTLGGRTSSTSLNYPFPIIAWSEDNGAPKVTASLEDADEPTVIRRPGQLAPTTTTPSKNK